VEISKETLLAMVGGGSGKRAASGEKDYPAPAGGQAAVREARDPLDFGSADS
jgi:hypothetical protein